MTCLYDRYLSVCIYSVCKLRYIHGVSHRITYCLSGSGKINASVS